MLIYDLSFSNLHSVLQDWGEEPYRTTQVWEGLYKHLYSAADQFTSLPQALRDRLASNFTFTSLNPMIHAHSKDHETEKILFELEDGRRIETVLMFYEKRRTVCISTQAGCGMGCVFCATGQMGLMGNLTSGEIVEQVLYFTRQLQEADENLSNIVTMGMGEPFHNYDAVMQAVDTLNHPEGFRFGARRITISTVGIIPMIRRFTEEECKINLAVSLHAATNELRDRLVPINRRYPLEDLIPTCRDYIERSGRRLSFEWALIEGVNDGLDQARALARFVNGMLCHVNLIPLNPTQGYAGVGGSRTSAIAFRDELVSMGIATTIRVRRGIDIGAGCGQLAGQNPRD
jgi:23S rRNA (adenine2503-C2)-methyltransferase